MKILGIILAIAVTIAVLAGTYYLYRISFAIWSPKKNNKWGELVDTVISKDPFIYFFFKWVPPTVLVTNLLYYLVEEYVV